MSADNSAAVEKKMIQLRSSDGELFQVEEKVAIESVTIKNIIEDGCGDSVIPMLNVNGKILAKVIEYCKKHVEAAEKEAKGEAATMNADNKKYLDEFDAEFVKVECVELFEIIMAANYMNIKGLLDLTFDAIADMIKDMTVEQVRDFFHIANDFTPQEEENIRKEHAWAFCYAPLDRF